MKYYFIVILWLIFSCNSNKENSCEIQSFSNEDLIDFEESLGVKSNEQVFGYELMEASPLGFLKYLSSVEAFKEREKLMIKGYGERVYIAPYFLPSLIRKDWIGDEERKQLMDYICSKQPAIPTMNKNAASLPTSFSTVGIEAMHLIHYSLGNEAANVSNRDFCQIENQDSLVKVFLASGRE